MAVNEKLFRTVVATLYEVLLEHPDMKDSDQQSKDALLELVRQKSEVAVDEEFKFRIHFGPIIAYGYDFTKTDKEGRSAKKIFEKAVEMTKKMDGIPGCETFGNAGVTEDSIGWYVTYLKPY